MAFSYKPSTQPTYTPGITPSIGPQYGGLQCLCRPRFFAGQLLTEEDLNRLEYYIIEKNKLHNRYLQGWGVVTGLEVVCNPCSGFVTVKPGYALSPYGEDIVVYKDESIPVCKLIKSCKDQERQQVACEQPYFVTGNEGSKDDTPEEWILAIRYEEKPSRGITALRGGSSSSSSTCGCGCNEQTNGTPKNGQRSSQKSVPPQCEPTVMCEGYVFEVFKNGSAQSAKVPSTWLAHAIEIYEGLVIDYIRRIPQPPPPSASNLQWYTWGCSFKAGLQDFVKAHEIYNCQLDQIVANIPVPPLNNDPNYGPYLYKGAWLVVLWLVRIYQTYSLISAWLNPRSEPTYGPLVPLATITVSKDNCQSIQICNLDTREFATTVPSLLYWLSFDLFSKENRAAWSTLYCQPLGNVSIPVVPMPITHKPFDFSAINREFTERLKTPRWVGDISAYTQQLHINLGQTPQEGKPGPAINDFLQSLFFNYLVSPIQGFAMPSEASSSTGGPTSEPSTSGPSTEASPPPEASGIAGKPPSSGISEAAGVSRDEELKNLTEQVRQLQQTLELQQKSIADLEARLRRRK